MKNQTKRKGFALILTLSVIVLLTGLLLSLLSLTTNKRTQTRSATEMMRVNALARGAADQVASTFLTEIKERSDIHLQESSGTSPRTIYKPRGDSMIPGRVVHPKLAATWRTGTAEWSNPNFVNLIRQSLPSSQLGGNTPPELKRLSNASIIRTSDTLDPSTWNKVQLTNGEFEVDTAPNWIYLDRLGNTQVGTNPAFSDKKKDEYIVGRYAFNVYNVGGLLDINSSGVTPSLADTVLPKKGSPLSLDITQIPGFDSASESELTKFFEWRDNTLDPETLYDVAGVNGASNDGYVTAGGKKGWLSAIANPEQTSNSNRFISRSDLIASLKELLGPENAAKALPHLSTENRFVDRPNHIPDPGLPQPRFGMNQGGSDAQFFPTANDGTWALVDGKIKPLMKQRFPLDRIALFENPSENEDKIREYFGLEEDDGYWEYVDGNPSFSDAIYTLDQVAELDREPNFFEILKAAIHSGSLGIQHGMNSQTFMFLDSIIAQHGSVRLDDFPFTVGDGSGGTASGRDGVIDFQIAKIAANIIDQYDTDSYPTVIKYPNDPDFIYIAGVESIPYIYALRATNIVEEVLEGIVPQGFRLETEGTDSWDEHGALVVVSMVQPKLWNPSVSQNSNPNKTPTRFRVAAKHMDGAFSPYSFVESRASNSGENKNTFEGGPDKHPWDNASADARLGFSSSVSLGRNVTNKRRFNYNAIALSHGLEEIHNFGPGQPDNPSHHYNAVDEISFDFSLEAQDLSSTSRSWPLAFSDPRTLSHNSYPVSSLTISGNSATTYTTKEGYMKPGFSQEGLSSQRIDSNYTLFGFPMSKLWIGPVARPKPLAERSGEHEDKLLDSLGVNDRTKFFDNIWSYGNFYEITLYYENENNQWIKFDSKYHLGNENNLNPLVDWGAFRNPQPSLAIANTSHRSTLYFDPRTNRWGPLTTRLNRNVVGPQTSKRGPAAYTWKEGRSMQYRNDYFIDPIPGVHDSKIPFSSSNRLFSATTGVHRADSDWSGHVGGGHTNPAGVAFNNDSSPYTYVDPDGVRRSPMGKFWAPGSYEGQPMAASNPSYADDFQEFNENDTYSLDGNSETIRQNRPIILNRPFHSVAELGYVFSGTPWRNLDFFTVESGDKHLLDYFCLHTSDSELNIDGAPITGGKIDLNSASTEVVKSMITSAGRDYSTNDTLNQSPILDDGDITRLAETIVSYSNDPQFRPFQSRADLVGYYEGGYKGLSNQLGSVFPSLADEGNHDFRNKNRREAVVRSLASLGDTGSWNLVIDLIAETGQIKNSSNALNDFVTRAQSHVWLHLTIDRVTGDVIYKSIEKNY